MRFAKLKRIIGPMSLVKLKRIIGPVGLIGLIGLLVMSSVSFAQTTPPATSGGQAIITWQANNYFPAGFEGKSLPAPYTPVVASVELLQNSTFTDISQATISWYVDDVFQKSGVGLKTFSFYTQQEDYGYASVRAQIQTQDGATYQNSTQIPIVQPKLVLEYPSAQGSVQANSQITITAIPFSFNISSPSDLTFFWTINGSQSNFSGNIITLNVGNPQTSLNQLLQMSVSAQNNSNPLEIGKTDTAFTILQ